MLRVRRRRHRAHGRLSRAESPQTAIRPALLSLLQPLLQDLPRGKVVLQLDGRTDIFRAKEVVGGHFCLFGDVPSTMLAFGGVQEVTDYCKKLIAEVGANGGFILAAGCEIPANARPENVKAMIEAARRFGYYS